MTGCYDDRFQTAFTVCKGLTIPCCALLVWFRQELQLKIHVPEATRKFFTIYLYAQLLRLIVPSFCYFILKYIQPEYLTCELCGLQGTFLDVFFIETFTHLCIDRYVDAKYIMKGWNIDKRFYDMYLYLCLFFAFLYSFPPVFGLGKYELDFDCETCSFDVILPTDNTRYIVVAVWFLRYVKPLGIMLIMLAWRCKLQWSFTAEMKNKSDPIYNGSILSLAMGNLWLWTPLAAVRVVMVVIQLMDVEVTVDWYEKLMLTHQMAVLYKELSPIWSLAFVLSIDHLVDTYQFFKKRLNTLTGGESSEKPE